MSALQKTWLKELKDMQQTGRNNLSDRGLLFDIYKALVKVNKKKNHQEIERKDKQKLLQRRHTHLKNVRYQWTVDNCKSKQNMRYHPHPSETGIHHEEQKQSVLK